MRDDNMKFKWLQKSLAIINIKILFWKVKTIYFKFKDEN